MPKCIAIDDEPAALEAQRLVCSYLVRACQQAIYDLALDDTNDPEVRHRAITTLRQILEDWRQARKELRRDPRLTFTAR